MTQFQDNSQDTTFEPSRYDDYKKINNSTAQPTREEFMNNKQWIMLPLLLGTLFGTYFNIYFQNFIQDQLMEYFDMDSSMYSWFVLIPNLPTIPLPLLIGPIVQRIGLRKSLLISTSFLSVSMGFCIFATVTKSTALLILAKSLLHISLEAQGIPHSCMLSKWFGSRITTAFTICSLINKANSSVSGIIYPQLYNSDNSPMLPFCIGLGICIFSLFSSFGVYRIDMVYDSLDTGAASTVSAASVQQQFSISDLKQFNKMYWLYVIQSPMMFGAFNAFTSYLQKILINKFTIDKTEAGELASIPFWVAFSTPLFGAFSDKFGRRSLLLILTTFFSSASALSLLVLSDDASLSLIISSLSILGLFLSSMCASLFPTIPYLADKTYLSSAFAIAYSAKNAGTAGLSFIGGRLMGDHSQGYDNYLTLYSGLFIISFLLSIGMYFFDRRNGSIINSKTPQRFLLVQQQKLVKITNESNKYDDNETPQ